MTALIIVIGAGVIAHTVLLTLFYVLLRDALHTANLRSSTRRQWAREERK